MSRNRDAIEKAVRQYTAEFAATQDALEAAQKDLYVVDRRIHAEMERFNARNNAMVKGLLLQYARIRTMELEQEVCTFSVSTHPRVHGDVSPLFGLILFIAWRTGTRLESVRLRSLEFTNHACARVSMLPRSRRGPVSTSCRRHSRKLFVEFIRCAMWWSRYDNPTPSTKTIQARRKEVCDGRGTPW